MKLQRLIENLLSFSAWQAKSVGLEITEFKLRPLIKSVLENQQLTLVAQRVRLDVQVEDLTPMADRGKLRLILDNLLSNAIKFTRAAARSRSTRAASADSWSSTSSTAAPAFPPTSATGSSRLSTRARRRRADTSRAPESGYRWSPNSSTRTAAASRFSRPSRAARIFACACRCATASAT
jgi:hypothetical protein